MSDTHEHQPENDQTFQLSMGETSTGATASPPPFQLKASSGGPKQFKGVVQREPTSTQAGTIQQFVDVFNNTPSRMGTLTGRDAHDAMVRLGNTEMALPMPLPATTPYFNTRPARYVYTTQGGWIDMVHFLFHGGRAYQYLIQKLEAAETLEEIEAMPWWRRALINQDYLLELMRRADQSPVGESVQEGYLTERAQQLITPRSAFSYEDIPSDTFGAKFAVEHFNSNLEATFGQQLQAYFINVLGATEPSAAPNFNDLPAQDTDEPSRQNESTTPVFTQANP